jgi:hypothetical protein
MKPIEEQIRDREAAFEALQRDPENLDLARAYWTACGALRTRVDVPKAFLRAALKSTEGVLQFVNAWYELNDLSGGVPRASEVEPSIQNRVRELVADPTFGQDRKRLQWFIAALEEPDEDEEESD